MSENLLRTKRILLLGREVMDHGKKIITSEDWLDKYVLRFQAVAVSGYLRMEESLKARIDTVNPDATIFHVMSPKDAESVLALPQELKYRMAVRIRTADLGLDYVKDLSKDRINTFESTAENDLEGRLYACLILAITDSGMK